MIKYTSIIPSVSQYEDADKGVKSCFTNNFFCTAYIQ